MNNLAAFLLDPALAGLTGQKPGGNANAPTMGPDGLFADILGEAPAATPEASTAIPASETASSAKNPISLFEVIATGTTETGVPVDADAPVARHGLLNAANVAQIPEDVVSKQVAARASTIATETASGTNTTSSTAAASALPGGTTANPATPPGANTPTPPQPSQPVVQISVADTPDQSPLVTKQDGADQATPKTVAAPETAPRPEVARATPEPLPAPIAGNSNPEAKVTGRIAILPAATLSAAAGREIQLPAQAAPVVLGQTASQTRPQVTEQTSRRPEPNGKNAERSEHASPAKTEFNGGRPDFAASLAKAFSKPVAQPQPASQQFATPDQNPVLVREAAAADTYTQQMRITPESEIRVPARALAVQIAAQANAGQRRFEIRMDPPELGRIDVRLDMRENGAATTRLVVERPETLDLLQRDARFLERALADSGLKLEEGGLRMSLKGDGAHHQFGDQAAKHSGQHNNSERGSDRDLNPDADINLAELPSPEQIMVDGRLDIRV